MAHSGCLTSQYNMSHDESPSHHHGLVDDDPSRAAAARCRNYVHGSPHGVPLGRGRAQLAHDVGGVVLRRRRRAGRRPDGRWRRVRRARRRRHLGLEHDVCSSSPSTRRFNFVLEVSARRTASLGLPFFALLLVLFRFFAPPSPTAHRAPDRRRGRTNARNPSLSTRVARRLVAVVLGTLRASTGR